MKKTLFVLSSSFVVIGLLAVALFVPGWMLKLSDKGTLKQVNKETLEMDTYELAFHSFAEKLYIIAEAQTRGMGIQMIPMPDNQAEPGNEELTENVICEVDELLENMWNTEIHLEAENLQSRGFYMLYGSDGGEEGNILAGIYLYRLVFVTEWLGYDNVEFEFYLDAEFRKLYRFSINTTHSNVAPDWNGITKEIWNVRKTELDEVLQLDDLLVYWGLLDSYHVEIHKGDEFVWDEKKNWGKGSQDTIYLKEYESVLDDELCLNVWSYLTCEGLGNTFHLQMGVWLDEVYDYTDKNFYDVQVSY